MASGPFCRVECRRFPNQGCDLWPLGVRNGPDWDEPLRHPIPWEQTAQVRQPDAVDKR
jgi:hypothetical protein